MEHHEHGTAEKVFDGLAIGLFIASLFYKKREDNTDVYNFWGIVFVIFLVGVVLAFIFNMFIGVFNIHVPSFTPFQALGFVIGAFLLLIPLAIIGLIGFLLISLPFDIMYQIKYPKQELVENPRPQDWIPRPRMKWETWAGYNARMNEERREYMNGK